MFGELAEGRENCPIHLEVESIFGQEPKIRVSGQGLRVEVGGPETPGVDQADHVTHLDVGVKQLPELDDTFRLFIF